MPFSPIDFDALYKLAEEQSVVGLIAAGLEHVDDLTLEKRQVMPFMKRIITLESRNASMNVFIASLYTKMREAGIEALLVKGQGIAQCYERPMWRAAGDIDLLLEPEDYEKAKAVLFPLASSVEKEDVSEKHQGMTIETWPVEIHGTLHCSLSRFQDEKIDSLQEETLKNHHFRTWTNGEVDVLLPSPNSDAVFIFAHILQHFFRGGIGIRQICDWARLLWSYRNTIDRVLLEKRINQMRFMAEWKAFGALAVEYLGMPSEAMPLYSSEIVWKTKAGRINAFILDVGNFGHNRDNGYYSKYPFLIRKTISLGRILGDFFRHLVIFPNTSLTVLGSRMRIGAQVTLRGE